MRIKERFDTDALVYVLAQKDSECMNNLSKVIDTRSMESYLTKVQNEFDIIKKEMNWRKNSNERFC